MYDLRISIWHIKVTSPGEKGCEMKGFFYNRKGLNNCPKPTQAVGIGNWLLSCLIICTSWPVILPSVV